MNHFFEEIIFQLVESSILVLEAIAIFVILLGVVKAVYYFIVGKLNYNSKSTKLALIESISLGLEFLLASEVLHSIVTRHFSELVTLLAICALRIIIGLVLHLEYKAEKEH